METKFNSFDGEAKPSTLHLLGSCLLALFLALAWTACAPNSKTVSEINPAGIYTLVSIDQKPVPCNLTHEGAAMRVKSGLFTIGGDGTCSCKTTFSVESGSDVHREVTATYTQTGANLTMKWNGAGMTTGTVDGKTFIMNNEGMIFAYQK